MPIGISSSFLMHIRAFSFMVRPSCARPRLSHAPLTFSIRVPSCDTFSLESLDHRTHGHRRDRHGRDRYAPKWLLPLPEHAEVLTFWLQSFWSSLPFWLRPHWC